MGDITVSGGGSTAVATDGMLGAAAQLSALAAAAERWDSTLSSSAASGPEGTPHSAERAAHVVAALARVQEAHTAAAALSGKLRAAAEAYGWAERTAADFSATGGAVVSWGVGTAVPFAGWLLIGAVPSLAAAFGIAAIVRGGPRQLGEDARAWLRGHGGLLRDPAMVSFVRQAVSGADDGMLGAIGVPLPLALILDDRATSRFGLHGAASVVVSGAGVASALHETPIAVSQTSRSAARAPAGFQDLADRVPANGPGDPQVRVERYDLPGENRPRWIVYAGGTVDTSFRAADEPWDDTSNIQGVAGMDSGSMRATRDALAAAGAEPGDEVLPVGYSQGGIVATSLARDGNYSVPALVTFGSPTAGVEVPHSVTDVAVEHRDDVIPALGGNPRGSGDGGLDRVLVQRTTLDGPVQPDGDPLAAHHIDEYRRTAAAMDVSDDPRLTAARRDVADFTGGADAQVTLWRADRVTASEYAARVVEAVGPNVRPGEPAVAE